MPTARESQVTVPVTLLMPTFNRADVIGEALDSILAQTMVPRQIIVINDGSSDTTADIVAGFGDRVRLVNKENGGKSTALNVGLELVEEPYVWIFDDDDVAVPQALELLYTALEADPSAGCSYGLIDKFTGAWTGEASEPLIGFAAPTRDALYLKIMQDFFIWQGAMLVRKSAYDEVGPFDVRYTRSQDYEMALRLLRRFDAVPVPAVIFHQRHHEGRRGPRHARFHATKAEEVWTEFNRLMFSTIYETHELSEFLVPEPGTQEGDLTPRRTVTALIQRGAIMARKGVWDSASADFERAAAMAKELGGIELNPQELSTIRTVFEHGARSQFDSLGTALAFRRSVRRFDRKVASTLFGNLMLPVTNRLRLLPVRPRKRAELRQAIYILAALRGATTVREYFAARSVDVRHYAVEELIADDPRADGVCVRAAA